jgi:hypothetical protein
MEKRGRPLWVPSALGALRPSVAVAGYGVAEGLGEG